MYEKEKLRPIGFVAKVEGDTSQITVLPEYEDGLQGLSNFSHIIILTWLHLNDGEEQRHTLKVTPHRHKGAPEVGVFASRSPARPNPIGLTVCQLLDVGERTLTVRELDAAEGTPIVDIKPYIVRADCVPDARSPSWTAEGPKT